MCGEDCGSRCVFEKEAGGEMIVEFEGGKFEDGIWQSCDMSLNDDDEDEIELRVDGVKYRWFAEDMMDGLALMFARKDRKR